MLLYIHIYIPLYPYLSIFRTLLKMKQTFEGHCKSGFRFPKFHLTLHYPEVITEFGSLHTVSSAHGERTHKTEVKPAHKRTSQKKRTANSELLNVLQAKESLAQLASAFDLGGSSTPGFNRVGMVDAPPMSDTTRGVATPGSTLSGYVTGDHAFFGRRYVLNSYRAASMHRCRISIP